MTACDACLRRTALIAALSGWLDVEWRRREVTARVLGLPDEELLRLGTSATRRAWDDFDTAAARERAERARISLVCRCDTDAYPERLRELADPPAVLHVAGTLPGRDEADAVAIVGARRATQYGLEVARALGRGLSTAGVPVVSGLALGVDSASHAGALEAGGGVVAVLACGADVPYPPSKRQLYGAVAERGCVVSELPPGFGPVRWSFVARNRIIAGLARVTVVVEAARRSGSLTTADFAAELGRTVGAVPGRITCTQAAGTNGLIQSGAPPVCGVADVLDLLADATGRQLAPPPPGAAAPADLDPELARILGEVEHGRGSLSELASDQAEARAVLAALGELEFRGLVRRSFGGRYERAL